MEDKNNQVKIIRCVHSSELTEEEDKPQDLGCLNEWGEYGEHILVGHGKRTSPKCQTWVGVKGCLNVEGHSVVDLEGNDYRGKVYLKRVIHSCDKPSCPLCYLHGFAVREAGNIQARLEEAKKKFGVIEHIVVSVPICDYGLKFENLKKKLLKVLKVRGVQGGVLILHAFRYANRREAKAKGIPFGWRFSPHAHVLGFVAGGYDRCRTCPKRACSCWECDGFEGITRRENLKDGGYIVKILHRRKTVFGSAFYQLTHASYRKGTKRAQVTTWFGTTSYRRLKLKPKEKKVRDLCPICGHELERLIYCGEEGKNPLVKQWWLNEFWDNYLDGDGCTRWRLRPHAN
jgi:hypothetical protein